MSGTGESGEEADFNLFRRYLLTGCENLYRVGCGSEKSVGVELRSDGVPQCLGRLLESGHGEQVVREITSVNLLPNMTSNPCLQALAVCARSTCSSTKKAAFAAVSQVCTNPAQLFSFIQYAKNATENKSGWGRALRRAVADWYNKKDPMALAQLTTRYKSSAGWTHLDVLRLSHTHPQSAGTGIVVKYLLKGYAAAKESAGDDSAALMQYLEAVDTVKHSSDEHVVSMLIRQHKLHKEHVPTKLLNSSEVWSALIEEMTVTEILTNFGKIASLKLLIDTCPVLQAILNKLQDEQALTSQRVPPMSVLVAIRIFEQGKDKGKWPNNDGVMAALNKAHSITLSKNATGSGKRVLVGVKISANANRSSVRGTGALSLVTAVSGMVQILLQKETSCNLVYFLSDVKPLNVKRPMSLQEICQEVTKAAVPIPSQLCDCDMTAPIRWAEENNKPFDMIVILTDSKESGSEITTAEAIRQYRRKLNLKTRLLICGLTAAQIEQADPNDPGSLDIAGFDSTVPDVISSFAAGRI